MSRERCINIAMRMHAIGLIHTVNVIGPLAHSLWHIRCGMLALAHFWHFTLALNECAPLNDRNRTTSMAEMVGTYHAARGARLQDQELSESTLPSLE